MNALYFLWSACALLVGFLGKDRNIGFGMSFFLALILSPLIGVIIVLFSDKAVDGSLRHKFKSYLETAKRSEYKGDIKDAIENYMNTLFHLESDYTNLDRKNDRDRQKMVAEIKTKVEKLKENLHG